MEMGDRINEKEGKENTNEKVEKVENKMSDDDMIKADNDQKRIEAEYKADMFRYKERMKNAEAEAQALKDEKSQVLKANLEKNEEWKLLYEKEKSEKETATEALKKKSELFLNSTKKDQKKFEQLLKGISFGLIGRVEDTPEFIVYGIKQQVGINAYIQDLKEAWQRPLRW